METNTVQIDRSGDAPVFTFSESFNVAVHMIDRHLNEGRAERLAYITEKEEVTYGQLAERVNRFGNALLKADIRPRQRMLMIVKDCPEFVYLYYGAIKAGIVPVPINTLLRAKDYQYMIEDSECAALVYSPEFAGEVEQALATASHKPPFLSKTEGDGGIEEMIDAASKDLAPYPSDAMAECFWLYSSGSTGRPKGTVHRQRDLLVNSVLYTEPVLDITESDIMFSAAKLFFAYGLGNSMNFPLNYGACTILS
ncbi:MAG: AMP-binding protein, partial [Pseudomonadota bacterium]|nr:AMP-binding protein [Pseudomonadota bacterium]